MCSCEKLDTGTSGPIIKRGKVPVNPTVDVPSDTLADRRSYFGNANVFSVVEEIDPDRPVGKLYQHSK